MEQERSVFESSLDGPPISIPEFMRELVAELTQLARRSPEISQRSGVSVRVSIANLETLAANAYKRAVRLGEEEAVPRVSDLGALVASTTGKIELETLGDDTPEERIVDKLLTRATHIVFSRRVEVDDLEPIVRAFEDGLVVETGESVPSREYVRWAREIPGMDEPLAELGAVGSPPLVASGVEFLLEGLHLNRRLNKERGAPGGGGLYRR
jgi:magnesium chelatase subunit I